MKGDQDLCLNFWYDFKKLLWQDELNPRVRCAFGNVFLCRETVGRELSDQVAQNFVLTIFFSLYTFPEHPFSKTARLCFESAYELKCKIFWE